MEVRNSRATPAKEAAPDICSSEHDATIPAPPLGKDVQDTPINGMGALVHNVGKLTTRDEILAAFNEFERDHVSMSALKSFVVKFLAYVSCEAIASLNEWGPICFQSFRALLSACDNKCEWETLTNVFWSFRSKVVDWCSRSGAVSGVDWNMIGSMEVFIRSSTMSNDIGVMHRSRSVIVSPYNNNVHEPDNDLKSGCMVTNCVRVWSPAETTKAASETTTCQQQQEKSRQRSTLQNNTLSSWKRTYCPNRDSGGSPECTSGRMPSSTSLLTKSTYDETEQNIELGSRYNNINNNCSQRIVVCNDNQISNRRPHQRSSLIMRSHQQRSHYHTNNNKDGTLHHIASQRPSQTRNTPSQRAADSRNSLRKAQINELQMRLKQQHTTDFRRRSNRHNNNTVRTNPNSEQQQRNNIHPTTSPAETIASPTNDSLHRNYNALSDESTDIGSPTNLELELLEETLNSLANKLRFIEKTTNEPQLPELINEENSSPFYLNMDTRNHDVLQVYPVHIQEDREVLERELWRIGGGRTALEVVLHELTVKKAFVSDWITSHHEIMADFLKGAEWFKSLPLSRALLSDPECLKNVAHLASRCNLIASELLHLAPSTEDTVPSTTFDHHTQQNEDDGQSTFPKRRKLDNNVRTSSMELNKVQDPKSSLMNASLSIEPLSPNSLINLCCRSSNILSDSQMSRFLSTDNVVPIDIGGDTLSSAAFCPLCGVLTINAESRCAHMGLHKNRMVTSTTNMQPTNQSPTLQRLSSVAHWLARGCSTTSSSGALVSSDTLRSVFDGKTPGSQFTRDGVQQQADQQTTCGESTTSPDPLSLAIDISSFLGVRPDGFMRRSQLCDGLDSRFCNNIQTKTPFAVLFESFVISSCSVANSLAQYSQTCALCGKLLESTVLPRDQSVLYKNTVLVSVPYNCELNATLSVIANVLQSPFKSGGFSSADPSDVVSLVVSQEFRKALAAAVRSSTWRDTCMDLALDSLEPLPFSKSKTEIVRATLNSLKSVLPEYSLEDTKRFLEATEAETLVAMELKRAGMSLESRDVMNKDARINDASASLILAELNRAPYESLVVVAQVVRALLDELSASQNAKATESPASAAPTTDVTDIDDDDDHLLRFSISKRDKLLEHIYRASTLSDVTPTTSVPPTVQPDSSDQCLTDAIPELGIRAGETRFSGSKAKEDTSNTKSSPLVSSKRQFMVHSECIHMWLRLSYC